MKKAPAGDAGAVEDNGPAKNTGILTEADPDHKPEALVPDTNAALSFLEKWCPGGPWVLTAIVPDGRKTATNTFDGQDLDRLRRWIDHRQGEVNIYFTVNPALRELKSKAKKSDIRALAWLHVDVDPRTGEDLREERERILSKLREISPRPTVIIDSGGGYQAFWRLDEEQPCPAPVITEAMDKDEVAKAVADAVAPLEAYSKRLELLLRADSCHNIDRVMRLPGTINVPGEKKRKKGRKAALASVVEADWDLDYPLDEFEAAPASPRTAASGVADPVKIPDALPDVSIDGLRVSKRIMTIIREGNDPADPDRYISRSERVFAVIYAMLRAGHPDAEIASVLMCRENAISERVFEQKNPRKYVAGEIKRARDKSDGPVEFVNRNYFAITEGRRVTFFRENEDDGSLEPMNKEAFTFELAPYKDPVFDKDNSKKGEVPYSKLWIESPNRRHYTRGFVLDPTAKHDARSYNLWKGFGIEPAAGNWNRLCSHVLDVLAHGNSKHAEYILNWTAWAFQNPATPPRVALVFKGGEGVGKGLFCNVLVKIFGIHGMRVQNMMHVSGHFNAHLRHRCLLFADEAIAPGDRDEGGLKGLITEPTIPIEAKGVDVIPAANHLHIVMASNNDWVIPAGVDARRFAVFEVSSHRKGDAAYFDALYEEMRSGGLAAMLHDLRGRDLAGWHPEVNRPNTSELVNQKIQSLPPLEAVWFDCLVTGILPQAEKLANGTVLLPTRALADEVRRLRRRNDISDNKVSELLGKKGKRGNRTGGFGFRKRRDRRPSGYEVLPLRAARRIWDEQLFPVDWDDADEWEISQPPF